MSFSGKYRILERVLASGCSVFVLQYNNTHPNREFWSDVGKYETLNEARRRKKSWEADQVVDEKVVG